MVGGFQFISTRGRVAAKRGPGIRTGLLVALVLVAIGSTGLGKGSRLAGQDSTSAAIRRLPPVAAPPASDPTPSLAAPSTTPSLAAAATLPAKARVSMSATGTTAEAAPGEGRRPNDVPEDFPLTRAATRQRIESMSPTGWLAHYGAVSIERHE